MLLACYVHYFNLCLWKTPVSFVGLFGLVMDVLHIVFCWCLTSVIILHKKLIKKSFFFPREKCKNVKCRNFLVKMSSWHKGSFLFTFLGKKKYGCEIWCYRFITVHYNNNLHSNKSHFKIYTLPYIVEYSLNISLKCLKIEKVFS